MSKKDRDEDEDVIAQFLQRHEAQIGAIITAFAKNIEEGQKHRQKELANRHGFHAQLGCDSLGVGSQSADRRVSRLLDWLNHRVQLRVPERWLGSRYTIA